MTLEPYKLLLQGIDTMQCAYFLRARSGKGLDFNRLAVEKEQLRQAKNREPIPVTLGDIEFFLQPYGSSSGYPFVLTNEDYKIEVGEFMTPSFYVTFRSQGLWRDSARGLHDRFLQWVKAFGFQAHREEAVSRVDFCFDYHVPAVDFDQDSFVTWSHKDSRHRQNGTAQTFTFGKGNVVLRVYDKVAEIQQESRKTWFYTLWGQEEKVWRIEWQVRKSMLRDYGITTFEDFEACRGKLLQHLAGEHDTLRSPNDDSNRSRWPLHPLWQDLQARIQELDRLESRTVDGKDIVLQERMIRMVISVYGYLKRMAAISSVQKHVPIVTAEQAFRELGRLLKQVHDPLTWEADVKKRIKAIELGEW